MRCDVCQKEADSLAYGYGKRVCSNECFHEAGKTYSYSQATTSKRLGYFSSDTGREISRIHENMLRQEKMLNG